MVEKYNFSKLDEEIFKQVSKIMDRMSRPVDVIPNPN